MIGRNDPCWCGSEKKWKKCHYPVKGKLVESTEETRSRYYKEYQIIIKNEQQIEGIRKACKVTAPHLRHWKFLLEVVLCLLSIPANVLNDKG